MHTLSAKPLAGSSCKTSSRRCFTSSASAISIRRKVHGAQRRDLPRYRLAATTDGQNAGDVNEGVARLERWGDKLDEFGSADTSNFNLNIPTATGERGPSEAVVFEGGAGPAEDRSHTEPHKLQDKASDFTAASSSSTITAGRDTSDMQNAPLGASSSSSKARDAESEDSEDSTTPRVHPVARTAGTAAASAAGTIIGAAAGPVGAAAGAAIGAAIGRRAADILGGSEEQGEVYDAGAEPEQVAEEVASAGEAVSHKARDAADTLKAKANELVDRASERLDRGDGGSSDRAQGSDQDTSLADLTLISGELDLTEDIDDDMTSGRSARSDSDRATSGSSKVSDLARSAADRVAGAAESLKETAVGAAHTAADKIGDAADQIPLPEFPPSSDRDQGDFHSAGGGVRLEDDRTLQGAKDRVSGAAESARDKLGSAAEEGKDRARSAAAAAKERLGGAGDRAADSAADYEVTEGLQATSIPDLDGVPAEDIVKADVGTPIDQGQVSSVIQSDNMSLTDEISSTSGGSGSSEAEKLAFVDQRGDESEQG